MIASNINDKIFGVKTATNTPPATSTTQAPEGQKRDIHALLLIAGVPNNDAGRNEVKKELERSLDGLIQHEIHYEIAC